ncbi:hypothetical protein MKK65_22335, partial [Methylobacterium sp. J-001]|uniref:hypothetical protein n=1 Tax=Methylobacterium sp. J-001 TaxID=2836609 RepID=UPI001FB89449
MAVRVAGLGRKQDGRFSDRPSPKRTGCFRPASVALASASERLGWVVSGLSGFGDDMADNCHADLGRPQLLPERSGQIPLR